MEFWFGLSSQDEALRKKHAALQRLEDYVFGIRNGLVVGKQQAKPASPNKAHLSCTLHPIEEDQNDVCMGLKGIYCRG